MLVLSRKIGERLVIGDGITVVVTRIAGNRVTLGIEAPNDVRVVRAELPPTERPVAAPSVPETTTATGPVLEPKAPRRDLGSLKGFVPRIAK